MILRPYLYVALIREEPGLRLDTSSDFKCPSAKLLMTVSGSLSIFSGRELISQPPV